MGRLTDRTTGDLLILGMAGTVCVSVLLSGALLGVLMLAQPNRDVSSGFATLANVINTLVGMVAGYLAGRTDRGRRADDPSDM